MMPTFAMLHKGSQGMFSTVAIQDAQAQAQGQANIDPNSGHRNNAFEVTEWMPFVASAMFRSFYACSIQPMFISQKKIRCSILVQL